MANHQIWGKMEPTSDSSCSASIDQNLELSVEPPRRRSRSLPAYIQQHLRHVVFHDESRSSDFHSTSDDSCSAPSQALSVPQRLPVPSPVPHAEAASNEVGEPPPSEGLDEDDDDDTSGAAAAWTSMPEQWSKGSSQHDEGQCKPCHYVHTKLGCLNGKDCNFCHIPHTKKSRPRPCKTKRMQCKRIVSMLEAASAKDPEQFAEATQVLSSQSTYLQEVVRNSRVNKDGAVMSTSATSIREVPDVQRSDGVDVGGAPAEKAGDKKVAAVSEFLSKLKGQAEITKPTGSRPKARARKNASTA